MRTGATAFASIITILVLPAVIALSTQGEAEPTPQEAELAIHAISPDSFGFQAFAQDVQILAIGDAPPDQSFLPSGDGESTAVATINKTCKGTIYDAGLAAAPDEVTWCVTLSGLEPGRTYSGPLEGSDASLTLTVGTRYSYWGWPVIVTTLGFVVAFFVSLWPKLLRRTIKRALLWHEVAHSESAGHNAILGLRGWVNDRLAQNDSPDVLLPLVSSVVRSGPGRASAARGALAQALERSSIEPNHRFRPAARRIVEDTTLRVEYFLSPDTAELLEAPPAAIWLTTLQTLDRWKADLAEFDQEIARLTLKCRDEAQDALFGAVSVFREVAEPDDLERLEGQLTHLEEVMIRLRAQRDCWIHPARGEDRAREARASGRSSISASLQLAPANTWQAFGRAGVAFAATLLVLVAFAYLSVAFANYLSKPEFGTPTDFWELFTAALGSTLAATVLTFVAYWDINEAEAA